MSHDAQHKRDLDTRNQAKSQMQQFARDMASGALPIRDQVGQSIQIGDVIIFLPPGLLNWQVKDIRPVLDPRAGPGLATITLITEVPIVIRAGQPTQSLRLYLKSKPQGDADAPAGATETTPDENDSSFSHESLDAQSPDDADPSHTP